MYLCSSTKTWPTRDLIILLFHKIILWRLVLSKFQNSIFSAGDVWREDRKLLNPSFKYQRFDGFLDSFNKNGKILVSVLKKYFKNGDQKVDLHPALCRCTMDTIFGEEKNYTDFINDSWGFLYLCKFLQFVLNFYLLNKRACIFKCMRLWFLIFFFTNFWNLW